MKMKSICLPLSPSCLVVVWQIDFQILAEAALKCKKLSFTAHFENIDSILKCFTEKHASCFRSLALDGAMGRQTQSHSRHAFRGLAHCATLAKRHHPTYEITLLQCRQV